ncbi:MAG: Txe/YoeB family addiction module toxin [Oscillospiraceae bacterium]|nr:Txe/YoeB family addiction module toxin [Oscillospiraceae bacterium]
MTKLWQDEAWEDYLYWQTQDRKTLKRINKLLQDIERNGYNGIGKPEPLKHDLQGFWSVEIDEKNRIVFRIDDGKLVIAQCGSHYRDK